MEIRRQEMEESGQVVGCFKCGKKGHKCKECLLWKKTKKGGVEKAIAHVAIPQKAQQKKLRRVEEGKVVHMAKPQEVQQEEWKRSLVHIEEAINARVFPVFFLN